MLILRGQEAEREQEKILKAAIHPDHGEDAVEAILRDQEAERELDRNTTKEIRLDQEVVLVAVIHPDLKVALAEEKEVEDAEGNLIT